MRKDRGDSHADRLSNRGCDGQTNERKENGRMREMIVPTVTRLEEKNSYLAQGTQNLPHLKARRKHRDTEKHSEEKEEEEEEEERGKQLNKSSREQVMLTAHTRHAKQKQRSRSYSKTEKCTC